MSADDESSGAADGSGQKYFRGHTAPAAPAALQQEPISNPALQRSQRLPEPQEERKSGKSGYNQLPESRSS